MAANNRIANERYHEWMEYFDKMEENKRKKQERDFLNHVLENGTVVDRSLSDHDLRLDCVRSNASEEIIIEYEDKVYYLHVENEICSDRIILCEEIGWVKNKEQKNQSIKKQKNVMPCGACNCSPCDCNWGYE